MTAPVESKSPEAIRKEEQRLRDADAGIGVLSLRLGPAELAMLHEGREVRGGEVPYSAVEYMATLLRRDHAWLQQQQGLAAGRICGQCRKPLPQGCGGFWRAEATVCEWAQLERALQL
ncbi:hypothetical protein [Pseudomonas iridis]|uniref:hypothetical protein n=1 Tax=Pseudomonas iridis TaxID=2710587 RepID=UPI001B32735E|nr:hypothetical protein [Pseudomonas iridis]MBP5971054.1 hypothetical protein [Pseudomonas iridis]